MPLGEMLRINPFETLWHALGRHFKDRRLQQLFGRYATYCGSSPFAAPATLMLVADVEAQGVWRIEGGMAALAAALEAHARKLGVTFHFDRKAERIETEGAMISAVMDAKDVSPPLLVCGGECRQRGSCSRIVSANAAKPKSWHHWQTNAPFRQSLGAPSQKNAACRYRITLFFFSDDYTAEFADLKQGPARDPHGLCLRSGQGSKADIGECACKWCRSSARH